MQISFIFFSILFLTACGYRFGNEGIVNSYSTISIPYILGDDKGVMTNLLIRKLATSSNLKYSKNCGALILNVCLEEPSDENIGFIFTKEDDGSNYNVLSANEARLTLTAKISLVDASTCCTLLGPLYVTSSVTYDFEPDLSQVNFHTFSLGQLEMHNMAEDVAFRPLFENLSQKIVDTVINSW